MYRSHMPFSPVLTLQGVSKDFKFYSGQELALPACFEVYCPVYCSNVRIGLSKKDSESTPISLDFRSSTFRSITVQAHNRLNMLVNGHAPLNKQVLDLPTGVPLHPVVAVREAGNFVVINPFLVSPRFPLRQKLTNSDCSTFQLPSGQPFCSPDLSFLPRLPHLLPTASRVLVLAAGAISLQRGDWHCPSPSPFNPTRCRVVLGNQEVQLLRNLDFATLANRASPQTITKFIEDVKTYVQRGSFIEFQSQFSTVWQISLGLEDLHQLGYSLNQQLFAQTLHSEGWSTNASYFSYKARLFSAFTRLLSLVPARSSGKQDLAEQGFFSKYSSLPSLCHHSHPNILLESAQSYPPIRRQFNVPLGLTLNLLPAQQCWGQKQHTLFQSKRFAVVKSADNKFSLWNKEVFACHLLNFQIDSSFYSAQLHEDPKIQIQQTCPAEPQPEVKVMEEHVVSLKAMGFNEEIIRKYLIMTKNQIEAALQLLMQNPNDGGRQNLSKSKAKLKLNWQCQTCTLINTSDHSNCSACQAPAPASALHPQQQVTAAPEPAPVETTAQPVKNLPCFQHPSYDEFIKSAKVLELQLVQTGDALAPVLLAILLGNQQKRLLSWTLLGPSYTDLAQVTGQSICWLPSGSECKNDTQSFRRMVGEHEEQVHWGLALWNSKGFKFQWRKVCTQLEEVPSNSKSLKLGNFLPNLCANLTLKAGQENKFYKVKIDREALFTPKPAIYVQSFSQLQLVQSVSPQQKNSQVEEPSHCNQQRFFNERARRACKTKREVLVGLKVREEVTEKCQTNQLFSLPLRKMRANYFRQNIPMKIKYFEGAANNEKFNVSSLNFVSAQPFVTNYNQAYFVLQSTLERRLLVQTVTVCSEIKVLSNGKPVGAGLIFCTDAPYLYEKEAWSEFGSKEWQQYVKQKQRQPRFGEWEPLGFFELGQEETQSEVDLLYSRVCRYVIVLPTKFRAKFSSQAKNQDPRVLSYLGVSGHQLSQPEANLLSIRPLPKLGKPEFRTFETSSGPVRGLLLDREVHSSTIRGQQKFWVESEYRVNSMVKPGTLILGKFDDLQLYEADEIIADQVLLTARSSVELAKLCHKLFYFPEQIQQFQRKYPVEQLFQAVLSQPQSILVAAPVLVSLLDKAVVHNKALQLLKVLVKGKADCTAQSINFLLNVLKWCSGQNAELRARSEGFALQLIKSLRPVIEGLSQPMFVDLAAKLKLKSTAVFQRIMFSTAFSQLCGVDRDLHFFKTSGSKSRIPLRLIQYESLIQNVAGQQFQVGRRRLVTLDLKEEYRLERLQLSFGPGNFRGKLRVRVFALKDGRQKLIKDLFYQDFFLTQFIKFAHNPNELKYHPRLGFRLNVLGLKLESRARHLLVQLSCGIPLKHQQHRYSQSYFKQGHRVSVTVFGLAPRTCSEIADWDIQGQGKPVEEAKLGQPEQEQMSLESILQNLGDAQRVSQQAAAKILSNVCRFNPEVGSGCLDFFNSLILSCCEFLEGNSISDPGVGGDLAQIYSAYVISESSPLNSKLNFLVKSIVEAFPQRDRDLFRYSLIYHCLHRDFFPAHLDHCLFQLGFELSALLYCAADQLNIHDPHVPPPDEKDLQFLTHIIALIGRRYQPSVEASPLLEITIEGRIRRFRTLSLEEVTPLLADILLWSFEAVPDTAFANNCFTGIFCVLDFKPQAAVKLLDHLLRDEQEVPLLKLVLHVLIRQNSQLRSHLEALLRVLVLHSPKESAQSARVRSALVVALGWIIESAQKLSKNPYADAHPELGGGIWLAHLNFISNAIAQMPQQQSESCSISTAQRLVDILICKGSDLRTQLMSSDLSGLWYLTLKYLRSDKIKLPVGYPVSLFKAFMSSSQAIQESLWRDMVSFVADYPNEQAEALLAVIENSPSPLTNSRVLFVVSLASQIGSGAQVRDNEFLGLLRKYVAVLLQNNLGGEQGFFLRERSRPGQLMLARSIGKVLVQSRGRVGDVASSLNKILERLNCFEELDAIIHWDIHNQEATLSSPLTQELLNLATINRTLIAAIPCSLRTRLLSSLVRALVRGRKSFLKSLPDIKYENVVLLQRVTMEGGRIHQLAEKWLASEQVAAECEREGMVQLLLAEISGRQKRTEKAPPQKHSQMMSKVSIVNGPELGVVGSLNDLAMWKKGSKNKLFSIHFEAANYYQACLVVDLEKPVEIHSVRIGFLAYFNDAEHLLTTPSSVTFEYSLDHEIMEQAGQMIEFQDEGYLTFMVRTFSLNFASLDARVQCPRAKTVRFRIRRPIVSLTEGHSPLFKNYEHLGCALNFVSLMGVPLRKQAELQAVTEDIHALYELVFTCLLSQFCQPHHENLLERIASSRAQEFRALLPRVVLILCQGSEQYRQVIVNLSRKNKSLGDQFLSLLLKHSSSKHVCDLLVQIVLSDPSHHQGRLAQIHKLVLSQVAEVIANEGFLGAAQVCLLQSYSALLVALEQLLAANQQSLRLTVKEEELQLLHRAVEVSSPDRKAIPRLLVLLLRHCACPGIHSALLTRLRSQLEGEQQLPQIVEILASVLLGKLGEEALAKDPTLLQTMLKRLLAQLSRPKESQCLRSVQSCVRIVNSVLYCFPAMQQAMRASRSYLPIYAQFKTHFDGEAFSTLLQPIAELIRLLVLGDSEVEAEFQLQLRSDLFEFARKRRNRSFVHLFVHLLKSEKQIPVSVYPLTRRAEGLIFADGASESQRKMVSEIIPEEFLETVDWPALLGSKALPNYTRCSLAEAARTRSEGSFILVNIDAGRGLSSVLLSHKLQVLWALEQGKTPGPRPLYKCTLTDQGFSCIREEGEPVRTTEGGRYQFWMVGCFLDFVEKKPGLEHSYSVLSELQQAKLVLYNEQASIDQLVGRMYQVDVHLDFRKLQQLKRVGSAKVLVHFDRGEVKTLPRAREPTRFERPLFELFERRGGFEEMIQEALAILEGWRKQPPEKWLLFIRELRVLCQVSKEQLMHFIIQKNSVELLLQVLNSSPEEDPTNKRWEIEYREAVAHIYEAFDTVIRQKLLRPLLLDRGVLALILERLALVSKEAPRSRKQPERQAQPLEAEAPQEKPKEDEEPLKKKGVGYAAESANSKWNVNEYVVYKKAVQEQLVVYLRLILEFLSGEQEWEAPPELGELVCESALLPLIESSLRGGSLLDIEKELPFFEIIVGVIRAISSHKHLLRCLVRLPPEYLPAQTASVEELFNALASNSAIFLKCLETPSAADSRTIQFAKSIIALSERLTELLKVEQKEPVQREALSLPLPQAYPALLKDLRFGYCSIKNHTYEQAGKKCANPQKLMRLAQELSSLSNSLPVEHTNAIFLRCQNERIDLMRVVIAGSQDTPYSHGLFAFDLHFEDDYPNGPPKMLLITTGQGKVRFNPNLYQCGKVCLSLLGTWRGNSTENWDPKLSTILQLLISTQAVVMSEYVYFNEPGFESEQGTPQGERKNEAYSNVVRYCNVKFAMIDQMRAPLAGFEEVTYRHFYIKRWEVLKEVGSWIQQSKTGDPLYANIVTDHNTLWCNQFKRSKTAYTQMLTVAYKELEEELNKLNPPEVRAPQILKRKKVLKVARTMQSENSKIDVAYEGAFEQRVLDIEDEKVKDRWSRYIGAMGIEAVRKQSQASVLLVGLSLSGLEIAKNLVLSGVKQLTIVEQAESSAEQCEVNFFLSDKPGPRPRTQAVHKLQELNYYVEIKVALAHDLKALLPKQSVVVFAEGGWMEYASLCRELGVRCISCENYGLSVQVCCDLLEHVVFDMNGEQAGKIYIQGVSQKGVVRCKTMHKLQDGDIVQFGEVLGLALNGLQSKVKVVTAFQLQLEVDVSKLGQYEGQGWLQAQKIAVTLSHKPLAGLYTQQLLDQNLLYADMDKPQLTNTLHTAYRVLNSFRSKFGRLPHSWNYQDISAFIELADLPPTLEGRERIVKEMAMFAGTAECQMPAVAAFVGGIVAQEVIKTITGKFQPLSQVFYHSFNELAEQLPLENLEEECKRRSVSPGEPKRWLKVALGRKTVQLLQECKLFVIGAGAIGCELLKNIAMLELGSAGEIVLTDPDHIEVSNLNRQFLFREKHLRKPKSSTAVAAVAAMKPTLKDRLVPLLQRVGEQTEDLFNNKFYAQRSLVANALDNVHARRYVDMRCVANRTPLIDSGTLGPKGHVQVVLPLRTQSYGESNDPVEQAEIPHCTLKMFPEEPLHCVQWARDKFGKLFTTRPAALVNYLQKGGLSVQLQQARQMLKLAQKRPQTFADCLIFGLKKFYKYFRNDPLQLLHTYPSSLKNKDGSPFWKLPKRPPTPILEFDKQSKLHREFVVSIAVLRAKTFKIEYPAEFRNQELQFKLLKLITYQPLPFVPSEEKANKLVKENEAGQKEEEQPPQQQQSLESVIGQLGAISGLQVSAQQFEKDDDSNGHIDLINAMTNLRSCVYGLEQMDRVEVKIKAGKIVPALATTTSVVAGYQTLQIIMVLKERHSASKANSCRNLFLNMAVQVIQIVEPGLPAVKQVGKHKISVWDVWEVQVGKQPTIGEIMQEVDKKYGVTAGDLFLEARPLFLKSLDVGDYRERTLGQALHELEEGEEEGWTLTLIVEEKGEAATVPLRVVSKAE